MKPNITPEMVQALRALRANVRSDETSEAVAQAIVVLDNAGVFAAIDAAAGCTCPADERAKSGTDNHYIECPQAPACTCPELSARTGLHLAGCLKTPARDDMPPQELEQAREAGLWGDQGYAGKRPPARDLLGYDPKTGKPVYA